MNVNIKWAVLALLLLNNEIISALVLTVFVTAFAVKMLKGANERDY